MARGSSYRDMEMRTFGSGTPTYLDTGGSMQHASLEAWHRQIGFKNTYSPEDLHGQADEDILILMNDGYDFYQAAFQNFERWYPVNLRNDEVDTRSYVFICRPDLYLLDSAGYKTASGEDVYALSEVSRVAYDSFFRFMFANHCVVLRGLTAEFGKGALGQDSVVTSGVGNSVLGGDVTDLNGAPLGQHAFVPFLTGRVESIQIPDYTIKTTNVVQPYSKYSIPFATTANESQTGGTFDITFREFYSNRLHKFFYAWIYYMDGVMRNKFRPKDKYIQYNAFDYTTSIYHIVCDATATTIVWWSKYTGCFPTSVPNSDFSFNRGQVNQEANFTVPFAYYMHEALNPEILVDFNYNSLGYTYMKNHPNGKLPRESVYNADMGVLGASNVGRPYITTRGGNYFSPELHWMPALPANQLMQG